jgi:hypothetical protein
MIELTQEQRTALHEAGHAVSAIQLGIDGQDFGVVTIVPEGLKNGSFSMREMCCTDLEIQRDIVVNCAGYGALRALGYPESIACIGCGDDFGKAEKLIEGWLLSPLDHWKDQATQLLSIPENALAVSRVSAELLKHKTLGPEYITILVMASTGIVSQLELDQFKMIRDAAGLSYWLE